MNIYDYMTYIPSYIKISNTASVGRCTGEASENDVSSRNCMQLAKLSN